MPHVPLAGQTSPLRHARPRSGRAAASDDIADGFARRARVRPARGLPTPLPAGCSARLSAGKHDHSARHTRHAVQQRRNGRSGSGDSGGDREARWRSGRAIARQSHKQPVAPFRQVDEPQVLQSLRPDFDDRPSDVPATLPSAAQCRRHRRQLLPVPVGRPPRRADHRACGPDPAPGETPPRCPRLVLYELGQDEQALKRLDRRQGLAHSPR